MLARQLVNVDSDNNESEKVQLAAKSYLQSKICAAESERKDVWCASQGLSPVQTFSHNVVFILSHYF